MHEKLEVELGGRYFLTDVDHFYNIKAEYEVNDNLKVTLGYSVYEGEQQGLFGQYDKNDSLYVETVYKF